MQAKVARILNLDTRVLVEKLASPKSIITSLTTSRENRDIEIGLTRTVKLFNTILNPNKSRSLMSKIGEEARHQVENLWIAKITKIKARKAKKYLGDWALIL